MSNLTISSASTKDAVKQFLLVNDFEENILKCFEKYSGQAMFGLENETIIGLCGFDEGNRLISLLNYMKATFISGIINITFLIKNNTTKYSYHYYWVKIYLLLIF